MKYFHLSNRQKRYLEYSYFEDFQTRFLLSLEQNQAFSFNIGNSNYFQSLEADKTLLFHKPEDDLY